MRAEDRKDGAFTTLTESVRIMELALELRSPAFHWHHLILKGAAFRLECR